MPISEYRLTIGPNGPPKALPQGGAFFCAPSDCAFVPFAYATQAAESPNIVVIMADDHAQWATGAYGLEEIETPNIDWLAREGVMFDNAMSPAPVCSAARASFYTGKMPSQHGVHDFLSEQREFDADWLAGETLLSERLQDAGYRVGLFGKVARHDGQQATTAWLRSLAELRPDRRRMAEPVSTQRHGEFFERR